MRNETKHETKRKLYPQVVRASSLQYAYFRLCYGSRPASAVLVR